ncbi:protein STRICTOSIDINE SYNTHASE-LIKE 10-like [Humulus lupulus]|uniref:protein STRICTOSIDINE SYNTHASE-LIKE 10-like n=1 Tax=Humulus lupulus TaxID=3486 RepID=UPI002B406CA7|nr:protein STRICTOSIDINE SYNTHASE-LIKE 10-like [Humulus lupulus]
MMMMLKAPLLLIIFGLGYILSPSSSSTSSSAAAVAASFVYPRNYEQIELSRASGPESIAFDCHGNGPYVSASDGTILKWEGPNLGWKEFAITSPNRPRSICDGSTNEETEPICGRPLGLKFDQRTCNLYIADAYFGLLMVGPSGGVAQQVATSANGSPFGFANALDIDTQTGVVYFTDSSTLFQRRVWLYSLLSRERTGRLIQYDPRTNETTVLLKGLAFPDGVALSNDKSFLLLAESTTMKIFRYWLQGPKAQTLELFAQLGRSPDNIKTNQNGEFWVALNTGRAVVKSLVHQKFKGIVVLPSWIRDPVAVKFDRDGNVVQALDGGGGNPLESVSEAEEHGGSMWFGSAVKSYVGVLHPIK